MSFSILPVLEGPGKKVNTGLTPTAAVGTAVLKDKGITKSTTGGNAVTVLRTQQRILTPSPSSTTLAAEIATDSPAYGPGFPSTYPPKSLFHGNHDVYAFGNFSGGADPMSLECWFRLGTADIGNLRVIVSELGCLHVEILADGKIYFYGETAYALTPLIANSSSTVADTDWHHLVITKSGATTKIYIDAVDVTVAGTNQALPACSYAVVWGCQNEYTGSGHIGLTNRQTIGNFSHNTPVKDGDGRLSNCCVYTTALSAARVLAHYNTFGAVQAGTITKTDASIIKTATPAVAVPTKIATITRTLTRTVSSSVAVLVRSPGRLLTAISGASVATLSTLRGTVKLATVTGTGLLVRKPLKIFQGLNKNYNAQVFPYTGILDNFNRADEGPPPTNWGTGIQYDFATGWTVTSNRLKGPGGSYHDTYWTANTFDEDQEVYVTAVDSTGDMRLYVRLTTLGSGTTYGYEIRFLLSGVPEIYRVTNGGHAFIGRPVAGIAPNPAMAAGDKFGARVVGTVVHAYHCPVSTGVWYENGSGLDMGVDSVPRSGKIGITDTSNRNYDDFGGGSVPQLGSIPVAVPTFIRTSSRILSVVGTAIATAVRTPQRILTVVGSNATSLITGLILGRTLAAVATNAVSLIRAPSQVLAVVTAGTASFVRRSERVLILVGTGVATFVRTPLHILATSGGAGSFPSTSILDDFNRGSLGTDWLDAVNGQYAPLSINANQGTGNGSTYTAYYNPSLTVGPASESFATLTSSLLPWDESELMEFGVAVRIHSPGTASYDGYIFVTSGYNYTAVCRIDNQVLTQLGAASSAAVGVNDKMGLTAIDSTLTPYLYQSGSWTPLAGMGRTDATYTAAGAIGLWVRDDPAQGANFTFDGFGGGTVVTTEVIGIATVLKTPIKLLTATATDTATLLRSAGHVLIVAASGIATILRAPVKLLAATATNTVTFIRDAAIALEAVATGVADLVTQVFAIVYTTLAATSTGVATLTRTAGTTITAVSGNSVAFLVSLPSVLFSVAGSGVATVSRTAFKVLSVAGTGIATLQLALSRILAALATPVGVLTSTASGTLTALGNAVSVLLSGPQTVLSALGTGVATIKRDAIAVLSAAATSVGALLTTKALTTSLTAVGVGVTSLIRDVATTFASLGSGVASLVRHPQIAFNAVASNAATILFSSVKVLSALGTGAVDLIRSSGRILSVAAVSVSALLRSASSTLALSASGIATAVRTPLVILYASASSAADLATEILVSIYYATLSAVGTGTATLKHIPIATLSAVGSGVGSLARSATHVLSVVGNSIAAVNTFSGQTFIAIGVGIATLVKQPARLLNAVSVTVPRLTKQVQRAFTTLVGAGSATFIKTPKIIRQVTGTGTAYLQRVSSKALRGTISGIVTLRRQPARIFSATISAISSLQQSGQSAVFSTIGAGVVTLKHAVRTTLKATANLVGRLATNVVHYTKLYLVEAYMHTRYSAEITVHFLHEVYGTWSASKFNVFKAYYVREWWRKWKG